VDDGLIETEKEGGLILFWSFPGSAIASLERRVRDKEKRLSELRVRVSALEEKKRALCPSQEEGLEAERAERLETLKELRAKVAEAEAEVRRLQENDPVVCEEFKAAANRWADNVCAVVSWLKDRFGLEEAAINKQFAIPDEFQYFD